MHKYLLVVTFVTTRPDGSPAIAVHRYGFDIRGDANRAAEVFHTVCDADETDDDKKTRVTVLTHIIEAAVPC